MNKKYFKKQLQPHFQISLKNKDIKTLFQSTMFFFFSLTWVSGPACAHLD